MTCSMLIIALALGIHLLLAVNVVAQSTSTTSYTSPPVPETTDLNPETTTSSDGPLLPVFPEDNFPTNGTDPAIILGEMAQQNEIPWQAYLFSQRQGSNSGEVCGGSLVRANWILTAAHCITDSDTTLVHLGNTNRNNMPYRQYADRRIYHQNYDPQTLNNDVAILRLPSAPRRGANIAIVPLAPANWGNLNNVQVRASGFGLTRDGGRVSDTLNKVNLVVVSNSECQNTYGSRVVIASTLCARWSTQSGQSTCNGDSGGPLTAVSNNQHYQVGVTSFVVAGDCDSGRPSGYARVTEFRRWIDDNIAANS